MSDHKNIIWYKNIFYFYLLFYDILSMILP